MNVHRLRIKKVNKPKCHPHINASDDSRDGKNRRIWVTIKRHPCDIAIVVNHWSSIARLHQINATKLTSN